MEKFESFWNGIFQGKKILITGHTGFKGSWLSILLYKLGAELYGYALEPPTNPNLYSQAKIDRFITSYIENILDFEKLLKVIKEVKPDVIIHMAAQPLVKESYENPVETFSTNIMGTVNLLEAIRLTQSVKAVINVTTDKCYENKEWHWGYRENEPLGGYDPYSNSKACSELVTSSYRNSFFNPLNYKEHGIAVATARAGNVIGGGDWAKDRLIPDFFRAIEKGNELLIRSPLSIRPWQFVLEPLVGYLTLAAKLIEYGGEFAEAWNFGPDDIDNKNVEWIANSICNIWGDGISYKIDSTQQLHEATYLKLDCSKAKRKLGWFPKWSIEKTIQSIVEWNKGYINGEDVFQITDNQINEFLLT